MTTKVICKGVSVQKGGYKVIDERGKLVDGTEKCVVATFHPVVPEKDDHKESRLNDGFQLVSFQSGAETAFELDKVYNLSISEAE